MADTRRNHIAADLRTPKYRKRVVKSRKVYDRKKEKRHDKSHQTIEVGNQTADLPPVDTTR